MALDPDQLDDNDHLFEAIEAVLAADPMQARWQRGIWRHQGHLRQLAPDEVIVEYERVISRLEAKRYDALLAVARWAFEQGRLAQSGGHGQGTCGSASRA